MGTCPPHEGERGTQAHMRGQRGEVTPGLTLRFHSGHTSDVGYDKYANNANNTDEAPLTPHSLAFCGVEVHVGSLNTTVGNVVVCSGWSAIFLSLSL